VISKWAESLPSWLEVDATSQTGVDHKPSIEVGVAAFRRSQTFHPPTACNDPIGPRIVASPLRRSSKRGYHDA